MTSRKLFKTTHEGSECYFFYCPGCKRGHRYDVPRWSFNGNTEKPTFKPSLRLYTTDEHGVEKTECHLHVTDGRLDFCTDSPHQFAGQIIDMVDFPEDYGVPGEAVG